MLCIRISTDVPILLFAQCCPLVMSKCFFLFFLADYDTSIFPEGFIDLFLPLKFFTALRFCCIMLTINILNISFLTAPMSNLKKKKDQFMFISITHLGFYISVSELLSVCYHTWIYFSFAMFIMSDSGLHHVFWAWK